MRNRSSVAARTGALLAIALLVVPVLAGCGGSADDANQSSPAVTSEAPTQEGTTGAEKTHRESLSASLTWPEGSDDFTISICASQGKNTIQGAGESDDGQWSLYLDANLHEAGDTGQLTVSQKSDMAVVYDGDVTELTVDADGSFQGSGKDVGDAPFTITGSCVVSW